MPSYNSKVHLKYRKKAQAIRADTRESNISKPPPRNK